MLKSRRLQTHKGSLVLQSPNSKLKSADKGFADLGYEGFGKCVKINAKEVAANKATAGNM